MNGRGDTSSEAEIGIRDPAALGASVAMMAGKDAAVMLSAPVVPAD